MKLPNRLVGLLAALTLLGIVIGLPVVLLALGASPIPHSLPSLDQLRTTLSSPDDGTLALNAIKVIAWAAWLFLTGSILLEIGSRLRGVTAPHLPGLRIPQSAARGLVAAALLLFVVAPVGMPAATGAMLPVAGTTTTSTAPADVHTTWRVEAKASVARSTHMTSSAATTDRKAPATVTHTVQRGESLWSIAVDHLGSGTRYPQIAALNAEVLVVKPGFLVPGTVLNLPAGTPTEGSHGYTVRKGDTLSQIAQDELGDAARYPEIFDASKATTQQGGTHLSDPDLIDVGWKLTIPARAAEATGPAGSTSRPNSSTPHQPAPVEAANGEATARPQKDGGKAGQQTGGSTGASAATPGKAAQNSTPTSTTTASPPAATTPLSAVADEQHDVAPWMLAGLTGGGSVLAGSMMLLLRRRRRAQFRARRPARTIATPPPGLVPVEKTVTAVGAGTGPTVELMDECLRRLATAQASSGTAMPEVAAVEHTHETLNLHLSSPGALTHPWQGSPDQLHWSVSKDIDLDQVGHKTVDQPAPYPLLVTIGASDRGEVWLLNFEGLHLSITGDATFGRDFARYIAAELACNPWSYGVRVDCVGVAEEVAPMNPERVRTHGGTGDPAAEVLADAVTVIDRSADLGMDVATARATQAGADAWPARMLLVDAASEQTPALTQLLNLVYEHAGHTGTSVVVHGDREATPGVTLHVTSTGRVTMPHAGLDLVAVGLTSDEAQGCAALLAQSEDLQDVQIPVDEAAEDGWRSWTNAAGALRDEHTLPRDTPKEDLHEPAASMLEHDDEDYLRHGATTVEDLDALAPRVPQRVRAAVEDADPTLDEDLSAWFADDCALPRLALLGPVHARTRGTPVSKRKPYYTEILAYLATRTHGATPEELAEAFSITTAKARDYAGIVREWLGTNPRTGEKHLPDARQAPAAKARGLGIYQVVDVLVDADLFRRLRVRGEARGAAGVEDLCKALRLVQGRPFAKLRDGGWYWLSEGDRLDQHLICAIVDVAHVVTTHSLQAGDLKQARLAAETAALAAPDEEIPRLDLAAVAVAEGHDSEAERILRDEVCNRTDDEGAPTELSDRTERIIASREWLQRDKAAS